MTAEPDGEDAVRLAWPAASDDRSVVAYALRVDGRAHARLDPDTRAIRVDGLSADRAHDFRVVALDEAANASGRLEARASTDDTTPPRFGEGAELLATPIGAPDDRGVSRVAFSWTPAVDARGVAGYRLLVDGEIAIRCTDTRGELTRALDGAEVFEVRAYDDAENESAGVFALLPGPTLDPGSPVEEIRAEGEGSAHGARLVDVDAADGAPDLETVERTLRARHAAVGRCYARALASGTVFDGSVVVELTIDGRGGVTRATFISADLSRAALTSCMRAALERLTFAPEAAGTVRARYAFAP